MKKKDYIVIAIMVILVALALKPGAIASFKAWTKTWPYFSSFVKFAILATFGECLALRLKTGSYYKRGFGVLARAVTWGVLGMGIYIAFTIFSSGAWPLLKTFGAQTKPDDSLSFMSIVLAFATSATMNLVWAPVMMVLHKIADNHIAHTGGSVVRYLTTKPNMPQMFREIDWDIMWGFVFKKTIIFWWIPAHTITFLLPPYLRVLFAAILGIALGVILSFAAQSANSSENLSRAPQ